LFVTKNSFHQSSPPVPSFFRYPLLSNDILSTGPSFFGFHFQQPTHDYEPYYRIYRGTGRLCPAVACGQSEMGRVLSFVPESPPDLKIVSWLRRRAWLTPTPLRESGTTSPDLLGAPFSQRLTFFPRRVPVLYVLIFGLNTYSLADVFLFVITRPGCLFVLQSDKTGEFCSGGFSPLTCPPDLMCAHVSFSFHVSEAFRLFSLSFFSGMKSAAPNRDGLCGLCGPFRLKASLRQGFCLPFPRPRSCAIRPSPASYRFSLLSHFFRPGLTPCSSPGALHWACLPASRTGPFGCVVTSCSVAAPRN